MRALFSFLILFSFVGIAAADVDALRDEANAAAAAGETDKAMALFAEIIAEAPDDGAAHYRLGSMLMDNGGDLDEAIAHFERAGELEFQPVGVAFRLSRIYARTGHTSEALDQLEVMVENGFGLPNMIEGQEDYASIVDEPRYEAALATIRAARFPCEAGEKHHAFDFWIGEWNVSMGGQAAGTNSIQPILDIASYLNNGKARQAPSARASTTTIPAMTIGGKSGSATAAHSSNLPGKPVTAGFSTRLRPSTRPTAL